MKAWLKGGLITLVIVFLYGLTFAVIHDVFDYEEIGSTVFGSIFSEIISFGKINSLLLNPLIEGCAGAGCLGYLPLFIILVLFEWFLIGALIGLIISKFKSKKQK